MDGTEAADGLRAALLAASRVLVAVSAASTTTAVHTSPKMKWQSRSRHSRCAEVISGFTTSTQLALPLRTAFAACSMAKVADEQATFMSKP